MPSQLRLVTPPGDQPAHLASVTTDARLRLWGAACCAILAMAFTALGYERALRPIFAGPLAAAFILWAAYLLATYAGKRGVRYTLTAQRLEIERGIVLPLVAGEYQRSAGRHHGQNGCERERRPLSFIGLRQTSGATRWRGIGRRTCHPGQLGE